MNCNESLPLLPGNEPIRTKSEKMIPDKRNKPKKQVSFSRI